LGIRHPRKKERKKAMPGSKEKLPMAITKGIFWISNFVPLDMKAAAKISHQI